MDQDEETASPQPGGGVVPLSDDWLDVAEQQAHARRRARVAIPTRQRDFAEVWEESPRSKEKRRA